MVTRIAMWSGPRNISTAMMRAWENRPDTAVWDEPLYGYYLYATGAPHPGAQEVMAAQGTDWRTVVAKILGPVPDNKPIFYQKHMTHHLLADVDRSWIPQFHNCFLIRDPREVLISYSEKRTHVALDDIGFRQQAEIFTYVVDHTGAIPPVVDARDVLENPVLTLRELCAAIDVPFSDRMLSWRTGPRPTDGVWAKYWYDSVQKSTGFAAYKDKRGITPSGLRGILKQCERHYELMYRYRLIA